MRLFLFLGSRRGYAVLQKLIAEQAQIAGILCLIEDPHEEQFHLQVTILAKQQSIPIFYTSEIKPAQYAEVLQQIKPDIAFAIGWRYLIMPEAYMIPPKGTLIIHDSLLPKYRGFAPTNWAIINGEQQTGVTLFYISEGVDSGPIVDQLSMPIKITDTIQTVDEQLIKLYEQIIVKNLPALADGNVKITEQEESLATYTCKRTPEDGEINWHDSATKIHNLIRGLSLPFPGAFTTLRGEKIFIWAAELPDIQEKYVGSIPGRVVRKRDNKIEVLTGDGILRLTQVQYVDGKEVAAGEILAGVKDTFGW